MNNIGYTLAMTLGLFSATLRAQDTHAGHTPLLLGNPKLESGISAKHATKISSRLSGVLTQDDATYGSPFSIFVLTPVVSIQEKGSIEGLEARKTVRLNLELRVANSLSGEVFSSADVSLTGAGANLEDAIGQALNSIKKSNAAISKSIAASREKIDRYYKEQCGVIRQQAESMVENKDYRQALAVLHAVPVNSDCYTQLQDYKQQVFAAYQSRECANLLQKANARVAANDFSGALGILAQVDSESPCAADARTLISTVETKIDDARRQEYEWLFKFWSAGAEAEKARWNALTALSTEWLHLHGQIK